MKTKTIITTILAILALVGLFVWGKVSSRGSSTASVQGASSTSAKSSLSSAEVLYDFGTISMKNGNVSKDFTFSNSTEKDVIVRGVETSCMCTSALLVNGDNSTKGPFGMAGMGGLTATNETIKVGESRTVRVVYDPNAHGPAGVGKIDRFITVTDSSGGIIRFEIKAMVTP